MEQAVKEQNQITTRAETMPAEVTGMAAMIERLAYSPDVDPAKLEKLLDMQERVMEQDRNFRQEK